MVLESIHDMLGYLGGVREERKAIIMVTEGWRLYAPQTSLTNLRPGDDVPRVDPVGVGPDGRLRSNPPNTRNGSVASKSGCDGERMALASMDNERYFRELLDVANKANSSFYPIDPRGLPVFDDNLTAATPPLSPGASQSLLRNKLDNLRTLADNTDGLAILNNNDLDKGLKRVSDDLTSYYLLGYYSTNTKLDGGFRALKVRVKSPGVSVRARRGYRAATATEVTAARAAATAPVPDGTAAAAAAVSELARIRPDVPFVLRAVAAGTARAGEVDAVWIAGELQAGKEFAGGGSTTIEITAGGATTSATAVLKTGERTFLLRVALDKPVGQADVRARFVPEGAAGTLPLTSTARLAAPSGLPEPLLFRRGVSTGNRQLPAANPQFSRSERVRLEVSVGPDDKPGPARLLDRTGQLLQVPLTVSERTDADTGQRWIAADLTLAALGAGDYVVELSATTGGTEKRVLTGIRVTR